MRRPRLEWTPGPVKASVRDFEACDSTPIPTPHGSCHVLKSLVDSHPELLASMVIANIAEHEKENV